MKNRKLFAILTLVAFMLTMMPVMAFASSSNQYGAWVEDGNAKILTGDTVKDANKVIIGLDTPELDANEALYVFAVVAGTSEVYKTLKVDGQAMTGDFIKKLVAGEKFPTTPEEGQAIVDTIVLTNAEAVKLDIKAVLVKGEGCGDLSATQILNKYNENGELSFTPIAWEDSNTVEFVSDATYKNVITYSVKEKPYTEGAAIKANNGVDYYEVTVYVKKNDADKTPVKNADVDVVVNKVGASVSADTVTTNSRGVAKFNVFASKAGTYEITLSTKDADDKVIKNEITFVSAAVGSVTPVQPEGVFATDNVFKVVLNGTDANGNALTGDQLKTELTKAQYPARIFQWTKVPANSVFDTDEKAGSEVSVGLNDKGQCVLNIKPDEEGSYTLKMFNQTTGSGIAYINFDAKDFDKTVKVVLTYGADTYTAGAEVAAPTVTRIDANGTKLYGAPSGSKFSFTGVGIEGFDAKNGSFVVSDDDKFLGKEIVVNAVVDKCFATATLKIADAPAYLQFTATNGDVATEVTVPVKSLDLAGNVAAVGTDVVSVVDGANVVDATVDYVVTSKPEGAVVSVDTTGLTTANFFKKGTSAIKVASTKEGTVTVNVILSYDSVPVEGDNDGATTYTKYLTGIAEVTFGKAATPVQTSATLIIGSNVFVANGGVVTAEVAPVINAGRTYLPIRALGEALGANVEYADGVITLTLGDQVSTLTVGSNVMTINGEVKTVDAAPYITDGRTMVPVRAAAEALGYDLSVTNNADGTVATVTIFK